MLGLKAFVALATLVVPSLAQPKLSRTPYPARTVPGKLLVELADGATIGARDGEVVDIHARFFEELDRRLPANSIRRSKNFNSKVFRGVSLDVANPDDVKVIAQTKGVKRIEPVYVVRQPEVKVTPAPEVKAAPNQYPPHIQTGVDKLHALGFTGKGVTVGIIDSGVDYLHPALGGGFGPGFKVVGGYDFVGDDGASPDNDPYVDGCNEHGTHVSGIVGADPNNPYNVTGVAYDASLRHYRVFGCNGETSTEIITNAMIQAYEDGVDIINMSLGGPDGWASDITADVGSRIARTGVVMSISAGNDGQYGPWYTSSPASGRDVIAIASVDNIALAPLWTVSTTLPGVGPIPYQWDGTLNPLPVGNVALPVYFTSTDPAVVDDACNPLPASTPDLSKFVTVVRRGTCNFTVKIQNAVSKGAKIILIYNNGNTFGPITTGGYQYAALIQDADGLALLNAFVAGTAFTVSFPTNAESIVNLPNVQTGGLTSDFSSFGPTFDLFFKPAVAGVGGGILNTIPLSIGGYGVLSGTSMSAPQFAGIAALLIQAKGKGIAKNPVAYRSLLQTTSTRLSVSREEGAATETLAQAGAGLANAFNALTYQTVLTPGELLLNDTAYWKPSHTIYIKNTGKKPKTYTIKHVPARTIVTFAEAGSVQVAEYPVPDTTAVVSVRFSLTKATVLPGLTLPILVHITAPSTAPVKQLPIYSGHIEVATAGETLRTSYLGAGQALKQVTVLDRTPEALGIAFPLLLDASGSVQEGPADYTLQGDDYPVALYRMSFGSPYYSFDLVAANFTLPTTKTKRGFLGDWIEGIIGNWFPSRPTKGGSYAKVPTLGRVFEYAYDVRNENYDYPYWSVAVASYANGTAIAPGSYRLLGRFLKVTGNAKLQEDYESWVSEQINVVAA